MLVLRLFLFYTNFYSVFLLLISSFFLLFLLYYSYFMTTSFFLFPPSKVHRKKEKKVMTTTTTKKKTSTTMWNSMPHPPSLLSLVLFCTFPSASVFRAFSTSFSLYRIGIELDAVTSHFAQSRSHKAHPSHEEVHSRYTAHPPFPLPGINLSTPCTHDTSESRYPSSVSEISISSMYISCIGIKCSVDRIEIWAVLLKKKSWNPIFLSLHPHF